MLVVEVEEDVKEMLDLVVLVEVERVMLQMVLLILVAVVVLVQEMKQVRLPVAVQE
jgi:hypothetical protein